MRNTFFVVLLVASLILNLSFVLLPTKPESEYSAKADTLVVLRKDVSLQEQLKYKSTTYLLRFKIDLNGSHLHLPEHTTIIFQGGSIVNGVIEGILDNEYVTPQFFGATANGIDDDTKAIQQALDCGKAVLFNGIYSVSRKLVMKRGCIMGVSQSESVIIATKNISDYLLCLDSNTRRGIRIEKMSFQCNNKSFGIYIHNPVKDEAMNLSPVSCEISDCNIQQSLKSAITWKATDGVIENSIFSNCEENGIDLLNVGNKISNCTSYFNKLSGVHVKFGTNMIENSKFYFNGRIYNENYEGPTSKKIGAGIHLDGAKLVTISNCSVQQNYKHGIYIHGNGNALSNINCYGDNLCNDRDGSAIYIEGANNYITGSYYTGTVKDEIWSARYAFGIYIKKPNSGNIIHVTEAEGTKNKHYKSLGGAPQKNGQLLINGIEIK